MIAVPEEFEDVEVKSAGYDGDHCLQCDLCDREICTIDYDDSLGSLLRMVLDHKQTCRPVETVDLIGALTDAVNAARTP